MGLTALAGVAFLGTRWPPINDVTTGKTLEYPDLQPGRYPHDPETVFRAARTVAETMPGWLLTTHERATRRLEAEARVSITPFTDDVTVWVEPDEGGSRVLVRSRSRVGRADLGVNARRVRAFLRALDRRLASRL
jgi:uncharacterized protein (DUF1499 family)